MLQIIQQFWDVLRFRKGPRDLPFSKDLLITSAALYWGLSILELATHITWGKALTRASMIVLVTLIFTRLVLQLKNYGERFMQTATALMGTGLAFGILMLPFILLQAIFFQEGMTPNHSLLLVFLTLVIFFNVWVITVTANIFRQALEVHVFVGLLVTIALMGSEVLLFKFLGVV